MPIPTSKEVAQFFRSCFRANSSIQADEPRWIGLENEYLLVDRDGKMARREVLDHLWQDLESRGWQLVKDDICSNIIGVKKNRSHLASQKKHAYDFITTDLGYAVLEIDLAPALSIHDAYHHLQQIIEIVTSILRKNDTVLLGCGVQPITRPDPAYIAYKSRSSFMIDICQKENSVYDSEYGVDLHTIDAACQTHVEVEEDEAIAVVNALNATSGLRIALLANSAVWQGYVAQYKALRMMFVDWCWPSRKQQLGLAPRFQNIEHYIDYIFDFRPIMVKRHQKLYRINNNCSFHHFFTDEQGQIGTTLTGETERVFGDREDVIFQSGIAWFNARLQPMYGTVEDRISCQQPPRNHLAATALTVGLVENHQALLKMVTMLSVDQWRDIHTLASIHGPDFSYPGVDVDKLLSQIVTIADQGLRKRGFNEEVYLASLHERAQIHCCPADEIIRQFQNGGVVEIVANNDMRLLLDHS